VVHKVSERSDPYESYVAYMCQRKYQTSLSSASSPPRSCIDYPECPQTQHHHQQHHRHQYQYHHPFPRCIQCPSCLLQPNPRIILQSKSHRHSGTRSFQDVECFVPVVVRGSGMVRRTSLTARSKTIHATANPITIFHWDHFAIFFSIISSMSCFLVIQLGSWSDCG
jgi:hypothetical protein